MFKVKLSKCLFAAIVALSLGSYGNLKADDMLPPPPAGDAGALPPPGADAAALPPPGADAGALPPPGADAGALPPPGADAGPLPPPGGDIAAPPAAPGAPAAPAPGGDMMAPPPGAETLAPPPADTQFKEQPAVKSKSESKESANSYTVRSGDSLWRISAKKKIYGNPFQWPLLFINNKDLIKDPDIIKPSWDLKIKRSVAADEVSSAVKKAHDTPRFEPHSVPRKHLPIEY